VVLVILVLIVLVAGGIVAAVIRRPSGDDLYSVQSYNNALGTLENLSERIGPPTRPAVRPVVLPRGEGSDEPVRLPVPPVRVRGTDEFPDPDEPIVFDDARPSGRLPAGQAAGADEPATPKRGSREQRIALGSMNHRRGPGAVPIAIGGAIVLFIVLAVIGSHHSTKSSGTLATTTPTTGSPGAPSTTRPPSTTQPPPTTLPTTFVATAASSTGTSATYTVLNTDYQLTLTGTGSCWVQVTSSASGSTLWAGALSAGTVQNVSASGTITVQFGTPTLTLAVNDIPLVLPSPLRTPFVATIQPSTTATPGTTTTTAAGAASGTTATTASSGATATTTTTAVTGGT